MKKLLNCFLFILFLFTSTTLNSSKEEFNVFAQEIKKTRNEDLYFKKRIDDLLYPDVKSYLNKIDMIKKTKPEKQNEQNKKEPSFWERKKKDFFLSLIPYNCILLKKEQAPELFKSVKKYAKKLDLPMPNLYLCEDKNLLNAGALSINPHSLILVGEKLLRSLTKEEVEAVLAHELSHIKHNHVVKSLTIRLAALAPTFPFGMLMGHLFTKNLISEKGLVWAVFLFSVCYSIAIILLLSKKSRDFEKEADLTALKILDSPEAIISLMSKFENIVDNKLDEEFKYLFDKINEIKKEYPKQAEELNQQATKNYYDLKRFKANTEYIASHPPSNERKKYLEEELAKMQKQKQERK